MILVTGATGLVGSHLLLYLIQNTLDRPIRALYRTEQKKTYTQDFCRLFLNKKQTEDFAKIEWLQGCIHDVVMLDQALAKVQYVYHCAAKISFDPKDRSLLRKTNIEGTANIVNLCLHHKVKKLCHLSSIAAIGDDPKHPRYNEQSEWNRNDKHSVYAISKYGSEIEVWRSIYEGLHAVIVNPGIIIGEGFYTGGSGELFKKVNQGMPYYTTGISGYVSVSDVVRAMHLLMKSSISNRKYIVVSENLTYKQILRAIATALHKKPPTRKVSKIQLQFLFVIQNFISFCLRTPKIIFRSSLKSAFATKTYDNTAFVQDFNFEFEKVEDAIKRAANFFRKHTKES